MVEISENGIIVLACWIQSIETIRDCHIDGGIGENGRASRKSDKTKTQIGIALTLALALALGSASVRLYYT